MMIAVRNLYYLIYCYIAISLYPYKPPYMHTSRILYIHLATYNNASFSQYYLKSLDTDTFELVRQLANYS